MKPAMLLVIAACGGAQTATVPSDVDVEARAAAMMDAFVNQAPVLAGDRVVFVSNRDGLPQLYVGERAHPDRAPVRLPTPAGERVADPRLAADGKTIVFLSDVGSDQNFHIFTIGIDGKGLVDRTPSNALRRDPPQIARVTGTLVYTGHTHADQSTHVLVQTIGSEPREVYIDKSVGFVADVTGDGTRALYVRFVSDTEQQLFVLDLGSGNLRQVFPGEGSPGVALGGAVFAPDAATIFLGSTVVGKPSTVLRIDTASGKELARSEQATGTVDNLQLAGNCLVVELDAGDHSEMRVLGLDLRPQTQPTLPLGSIRIGQPVGTQVPLTITTAAGPTDIAVLDAVSGTIEPLRAEPRKGLGTPPRATIETLVAFDGRKLPVNLYVPDGPVRKRPTLVLVHGGPSGSAKIGWSATIGFWTAMGFAVVAPNIRGSSGFGIEYEQADNREKRADAVRDMETINTWARQQPWCDGDRMVVGGISYGGYMTLLLLTRQPTLWRAGIDGSGMSNLKTMEELEDQTIRAFDDTEFGMLGKDDALLAEWSPITAVDKIVAPVFVYQGVRDPVTPQHEADQIVDALKKRNVPVEYMLVANEGHGVTRRENIVAYLARSYRFLAAHMELKP